MPSTSPAWFIESSPLPEKEAVDEGPETQRGEAMCSRLHSLQVLELELKPSSK